MTARKIRPEKGTPITDDMSMRDIAAALGMSTAELSRWTRLSEVPEEDFERRLKEQLGGKRRVTAESIIRGEPVPSPGRVDRAKGLFRAMNKAERRRFLAWVNTFIEQKGEKHD